MINKERLEKYCKTLDNLQLIEFIQQQVRDLKKYYKQKEKTLQKEIDDWYNNSRAKNTTNYANWYNCSRMYNESKEVLNELITIFNKRI